MLNKKRLSDYPELKKNEHLYKIPLLLVNNPQIHNQNKKETPYLTPNNEQKKINSEEFTKTADSTNKNSKFFY